MSTICVSWFDITNVCHFLVKENVRKRPLDARGLGRQGAVRQRKGEVHEMNGHKFVQRQFYQIILCAFCSEFLLNATGYQCEDCRYTCHKKCYEKVVTKCISKSTSGVRFRVSLKELLEGWLIEGVRMMTRTKLTTGFHIVSKQLRISAQIGAVTVVICYRSDARTHENARNVTLLATQIALI